MSQWDPQQRDREFRTIRSLTTGLVIGSVGATVILGYGIAWGDQQRVDQADEREAEQATTQSPSGSTPTKSSSTKPKKPKSKSGGS